jgi:hypothetical protein
LEDSCVVDEYVDPSVMLDHIGDDCFPPIGIGDVEVVVLRATAQILGDDFTDVVSYIGEDDGGAFRCE